MYYTELYFKIQVYVFVVILSVGLFLILGLSVAKFYIKSTEKLRDKMLEEYKEKETNQ